MIVHQIKSHIQFKIYYFCVRLSTGVPGNEQFLFVVAKSQQPVSFVMAQKAASYVKMIQILTL
jgi:hypothetical protein